MSSHPDEVPGRINLVNPNVLYCPLGCTHVPRHFSSLEHLLQVFNKSVLVNYCFGRKFTRSSLTHTFPGSSLWPVEPPFRCAFEQPCDAGPPLNFHLFMTPCKKYINKQHIHYSTPNTVTFPHSLHCFLSTTWLLAYPKFQQLCSKKIKALNPVSPESLSHE